jgi:hypothetical protein
MLAALCDPAISTAAVAALIEQEPAMVARVLRVANSSYYGQPRSIRTPRAGLAAAGGSMQYVASRPRHLPGSGPGAGALWPR